MRLARQRSRTTGMEDGHASSNDTPCCRTCSSAHARCRSKRTGSIVDGRMLGVQRMAAAATRGIVATARPSTDGRAADARCRRLSGSHTTKLAPQIAMAELAHCSKDECEERTEKPRRGAR
jgi:hypothetical protein